MKDANPRTWLTTTTILEDLRNYENEDVWRSFVHRFRAPIESFVRRVGISESDRPDVAQSTLLAFADAYRQGKYDRDRGRLSRWLFGIAWRQALMHRRKQEPAVALQPLDDEAEAIGVWDELWDRFLLEEGVERARLEFTTDTFAAFQLVVLEDLSPADAAERLEVPIKQVYNAKHRVLQRLRELMAELDEVEPGR